MKTYTVLRTTGARAAEFRVESSLARDREHVRAEIDVTSLTDRQAVAAAEHAIVAPVMPLSLIEPTEVKAEAAGSAWGIAAVGADTSPFTGEGVTVAVLDTGIDAAHPAFSHLAITQKDFTGEGDGDGVGHGTHCAGTIFGQLVGERIGVAPGVKRALIAKVLDKHGRGGSEKLFEALQWAVNQEADIISMSLGFDFPGMVKALAAEGWPIELATSNALEAYRKNLRVFDALMQFFEVRGPLGGSPLVVAAAGNESERDQRPDFLIAASLPAAAEDVVSVAAVGPVGQSYGVATFSNTQPVVAAPGVNIRSAAPGGGFATMSGTSMACPHVAGVAALWWQAFQESDVSPQPASVRARILASARRDVFGATFDESDVGVGLVAAPQTKI